MYNKKGIRLVPFVYRFWNNISIGSPDQCWEWQSGRLLSGYGRINVYGVEVRTHRLMYQLCVGPIPKNLIVCHSCDNPPCCNPAHLFLGTRTDNANDKVKKNRQHRPTTRGEQMPTAKLTKTDVISIRKMFDNDVSIKEITALYPVSYHQIWLVVTRKNWKHL